MKNLTTLIISLFFTSVSFATTINVPADYSTIQAGIDAAAEGDTVLVAAGTYVENITWPATNGIQLIGEDRETTIIDGDSLGSVIRFTSSNIETATLITGFTITNGSAGGIYCVESSPSLVDVTITDNSATSSYLKGGGIYCGWDSSPSLENVTITNNSSSDDGGGIYCYSSSPSLDNVTITDNSSSDDGGGMYCAYSSPSLENVTITDNSASYDGGGIYCSSSSSPSLVNVTISGNSASYGGGIYCYSSSPSLENVTITDNSATSSYSKGGGIYCSSSSSPSLVNVTISGNSASYGGGGIYCGYNSSPSLVNCILWNDAPQEVYFYEDDSPNSIMIAYSDIQGGEAGIVTNNNGTVYWEDGNIDLDPLFVDAANGDYRLSDYSPAIGAGTATGAPTTDIEGNIRPNPAGSTPDMGAYENALGSPSAPPAPIISISPDSLNFTISPPDSEQTQTLTISNTGDATLEVNLFVGSPPVVDIDGNVYQTVQIGDQVWMAENLKVTHYRNGDAIPNVTSNSEWAGLSTGAYCAYDDNESNADTYGYLYNWYAVDDSRNIAPEGWHVPTDDEWKTLEMHLGMSQSEADDTGWRGTNVGSKLAGNADLWYNGNLENNAEFGTSGFTALPGGCRIFSNGIYYSMGGHGYFWSSTEYSSYHAWYRILYCSDSRVYRFYNSRGSGSSVRCLRDLDNLTIRQFDNLDEPKNETHLENYAHSIANTQSRSSRTDWLTFSTDTLTIQPGTSADVTVTVNAGGLGSGIYSEYISITSNDTANSLIVVPVTMSVANSAPIVNAGSDQEIMASSSGTASVTLDGSATYDLDGDAMTYSWVLDGTEVSTAVTFTTDLSVGVHTFTLTANDGALDGTDDVVITVTAFPNPIISISPDSLNFTISPPDSEQTQTLTISNTGDATLEVNLFVGSPPVVDIDGNVYQTVQIGDQVWMAENLKVTHYRNGDAIPNVTSNSEWAGLSTGAYCAYDDNESNADTYGYLYNWYAVDDSRNIAPQGWHVPTDDEIKQLEMHLGMSQSEADDYGFRGTNEGSKLAGNADLWYNGNLENNADFGTSGFTALPGGYRYYLNGNCSSMGSYGFFWSSTEGSSGHAWRRELSNNNSGVNRFSSYKQDGFSVRCLRDLDNLTIRQFDNLDEPKNETHLENYAHSIANTQSRSSRTDWLIISTDSLTIQPGTSADVTVTVNAADLGFGVYSDNIIITSNDTANSLIVVPATMTVDNSAPFVFQPIDDVAVDEDADTLSLLIDGVFDDADIINGDTLTITAVSLNTDLITIGSNTNEVPYMVFVPDANGETDVVVTATDLAGLSVNDTVHVTVNAVNDAPTDFALLSPDYGNTIVLTNENLSDTLWFEWDASMDVDGDSLSYLFNLSDETNMVIIEHTVSSQVFGLEYSFFAEIIDTLYWNVMVSDGVDTLGADNGPFTLFVESEFAIDPMDLIPEVFALHQNYPNPFNPTTTLRYDLPEDAKVKIMIYDLMGREVRSLVNNQQNAGFKSVVWDATNESGQPVSAGMYLYRISAGNFHSVKKMVLLK